MSQPHVPFSRSDAFAVDDDADDAWIDELLPPRPTPHNTAATSRSPALAGGLSPPVSHAPMHRSGAIISTSPARDHVEAERERNGRYGSPLAPLAPGRHEESVSWFDQTSPPPLPPPPPEGDEASVLSVWASKLSRTSPWVLMRVALLCACVLGGQAAQIIMLNFWLQQFPSKNANGEGGVAGNYTILAVSGFIFFVFFLLLFVVYVLIRRPDLRFMREPRAWGLLMRAAAMDMLTSALSVYAASHTSEVLQALFVSMVPLYASLFTKVFLHDHREYRNMWVLVSFSCIVAGVFVATSANFYMDGLHTAVADVDPISLSGTDCSSSGSGGSSSGSGSCVEANSLSDRRWWALLFCAAIPLEVMMGVFQTLFMLRYTHDPEFFAYVAGLIVGAEENPPAVHAAHNYRAEVGSAGDDGTTTLLPFEEEEEDVASNARDRGSWRRASSYTTGGLSSSSGGFGGVYRHPTSVMRLAPLSDPFHGSRHQEMRHTLPPRLPRQVSSAHAPAASHRAAAARDMGDAWTLGTSPLRPTGDDTTVKLTMLCLQTFFQCVFTFAWLPMDALPWYGGSSSVGEAWTNFAKGVDCLLHCPNNLLCGALYSAGFVFVYIGAAYLNQYSVTLCAMVSQMSGPVTALLLIAFPALNVTGDSAPWYVSLVAVCLLAAGTFVYVVWDEKTAAEKEAGELELKMEMHGLKSLAARHAEYASVETIDS